MKGNAEVVRRRSKRPFESLASLGELCRIIGVKVQLESHVISQLCRLAVSQRTELERDSDKELRKNNGAVQGVWIVQSQLPFLVEWVDKERESCGQTACHLLNESWRVKDKLIEEHFHNSSYTNINCYQKTTRKEDEQTSRILQPLLVFSSSSGRPIPSHVVGSCPQSVWSCTLLQFTNLHQALLPLTWLHYTIW